MENYKRKESKKYLSVLNMSRWDEIKRHARRKCFYRRLLHGYGFPYITTIGIHVENIYHQLNCMIYLKWNLNKIMLTIV